MSRICSQCSEWVCDGCQKHETECKCRVSNHTIKHTHRDGVQLPAPEYWCGAVKQFGDWHFLDAQHLALSVDGSVQPCVECVKAIIKELEKEL